MLKHIHILPVTVAVLVLIFGLKLNAVWTEAQGFLFDVAVSEVYANEAKSEPAGEHGAKAPEEQNSAVSTEKPVEAAPVIAGVTAAGKEFSASEVKVLERLSDRRAELDRRNQALDMRDNLLKATETRIDEKIIKLKEMETTLNKLLQMHDDQETAQLESLVKIYEKMKPKDAARIFNNLEMDILIDVASKIKEAKMAAILAAMNSQQANKLTVELATRRSLPEVDSNKS